MADNDYFLLAAAKEVSVYSGGSVLASGQITDICRRSVPEGTLTEVVFSAGIGLWEAPVSLSVEAVVSVSETVRRILDASGIGMPLLYFPEVDPVRTRGQVFCGRAAECVEEALFAAGVQCCLVPSGLCVVPDSGLPVSVELSENDLIDAPVRAGRDLLLLRTAPVGWPLGKTISMKWKDGYAEGLILERSVDADNTEGKWQSELVVRINGGIHE